MLNHDEKNDLLVCRLPGLTAYDRALCLQEKLQDCRIRRSIGDSLLLLQHPPVLTLGTRGDQAHIYADETTLAAVGVTIHRVGRGGDVTYHGPGQVVGYPIIDVRLFPGRIRGFVQAIETAVITLLAEQYGITAEAGSGKMTGVWVDGAKICAIGLSIRQGVTMHGFAFNINTNLAHFNWINPCGLSQPVTSLAKLLGSPVDMTLITDLTARSMARCFGKTIRCAEPEQIWARAGLPATLQES